MENISGETPLKAIPTDKKELGDFKSLDELYDDIAKHLYVSVEAGKSITGARGPAGSISVGAVETLEPEEPASVSNSGNSQVAIFNFGIPQGHQGEPGPQGSQGIPGPQGPAGTSDVSINITEYVISDTSTFIDVPATLSNIFQLQYVDDTDPSGAMLPAASAISAILDLQSGYIRVHFTVAIADENYKLLVYSIS